MGSFYANIHLCCTDRQVIEDAWRAFWEARDETSLVWISPPYGGWISLFDWRCDQQNVDLLTGLTAQLSQAINNVALAFQVQDSELAEYWLFHNGTKADYYSSNTEYFAAYAERPEVTEEAGVYSGFGPDSKPGFPTEEDHSDGGNTRVLKTLTGTAVDEMELDAVLRSPATFADDILTALASVIGINDIWASVGYHYLVTEGDMIPGFDKFIHRPMDTPPAAHWFEERE